MSGEGANIALDNLNIEDDLKSVDLHILNPNEIKSDEPVSQTTVINKTSKCCCLPKFCFKIIILIIVMTGALTLSLYVFSSGTLYNKSWDDDICKNSSSCTKIKEEWYSNHIVTNTNTKMLAIIKGIKLYDKDGREAIIFGTFLWYTAAVLCTITIIKIVRYKMWTWVTSLF